MRWRVLGTLVLLLAASSTTAGGQDRAFAGLAWPAGNPRVRLERIVETARPQRGVARLLGWFGSKEQAPLFQRPYAVAWAGDDLLVADPGARRVLRISPDGTVNASSQAVGHPMGVAVCAEGVVVSDAEAGTVVLLGPDLERREVLAEGLARPTGVACSGNRLYVVETAKHRLMIREGGGSWHALGERGGGPGEFNFPATIAVGADALWVGDTLNFRIQRLGVDGGGFIDIFGRLGDAPGEMPRMKGVAVDAAGHLWVSDALLDRVSLYDAGGRLLLSLGGRGSEPGRFSFPAGIAAHPDGRVAVVDALNRRVQVFRLLDGGGER